MILLITNLPLRSKRLHHEGVASEEAKVLLIKAQKSLEEGRFDDARRNIEEAFAVHPDDEKVLELYQQICLADGMRLTRAARDLRRDEIRALEKRERAFYSESEDVKGPHVEVRDTGQNGPGREEGWSRMPATRGKRLSVMFW